MLISYHNHTIWSDGKATIPELIEGARRHGVTELGISDHFAIAPDKSNFFWAIQTRERLDSYVQEVLKAIRNTSDITVRLGVEVDYFPETLDESMAQLQPYPFDFIIGSVHFVNIDLGHHHGQHLQKETFCLDLNAGVWEEISPEKRDEAWQIYWQCLADVAQSGCFDFIGHFDLPKKFKFYPSIDLTASALAALDAIAKADMAIEINTSGWHKEVEEAYPALFYIKEARRRNIPLLINADAHEADHVARDFARARMVAAEAGYLEMVCYENRKRSYYPLAV